MENIKGQIEVMYQSSEEFPVDFDNFWQWLGYSRKYHALQALKNCGFAETLDYYTFADNSVKGTRPAERYFLTLDCAKQFAMMAGTEQGKQVRLYFLEVEKAYKQLVSKKPLTAQEQLDLHYQINKEQDARLDALESKVDSLLPSEQYLTLIRYTNRFGIKPELGYSVIGKKLTKLSKELGYDIQTVPDMKYGKCNAYHIDILHRYFNTNIN